MFKSLIDKIFNYKRKEPEIVKNVCPKCKGTGKILIPVAQYGLTITEYDSRKCDCNGK